MRRLIPIAGNQIGGLVLAVVGLKLISHWVPVGVYGDYVLFLTMSQLGALLTHSDLINCCFRCWQREAGQSGAYGRFLWGMSWKRCVRLACLLGAVVAGVVVYQGEMRWWWAWPLLVVSNLGLLLWTMVNGALVAEGRTWTAMGIGVLSAAGRAFAPVVFLIFIGESFLALGTGFAAQNLVIIGLIVLVFWNRCQGSEPTTAQQEAWAREVRHYGRAYVWMGVCGWALQNWDRWLVDFFWDRETTGLFGFAATIGTTAAAMGAGVMIQMAFPGIFRKADSARTKADWIRLARQCDAYTLAFVVAMLAGFALLQWANPWLVGTVIGEKYGPAMEILLPVGLGMACVQVNQFQYMLLQGQYRSGTLLRVMIVVVSSRVACSVAAACISWKALLTWEWISLPVAALLGRILTHRAVFSAWRGSDQDAEPVLETERLEGP